MTDPTQAPAEGASDHLTLTDLPKRPAARVEIVAEVRAAAERCVEARYGRPVELPADAVTTDAHQDLLWRVSPGLLIDWADEIDALRERLARAEDELSLRCDQIQTAETREDELQQRIASLESSLASAEARAGEAEHDRDVSQARVRVLEGEQGQHKATIARLTRESSDRHRRVDQFEKMLPADKAVCVACRDAGCDPDEYVYPRDETVDCEDYGRVCHDCAAEFEADADEE